MDNLGIIRREEELRGRWHTAGGKYYKAMNGSIGGGGSPTNTNVTFSSTAALFEIENPNQVYPFSAGGSPPLIANAAQDPLGQGSIFVYPHYVRFTVVSVGTGTTSVEWSLLFDQGLRFNAGGFQPISPEYGAENISVMNQAGFAPTANIHIGAVTLTAQTANRLVAGRGTMKAAIPVVGDEFLWTFGEMSSAAPGLKSNTVASLYVENCGPVCVAPRSTFAIMTWYPAMATAFNVEFECAWWERQF